ncbi:MAG: hypothetical protein K0S47_2913 [Herbinix sp.]|jgi:hypothetical protein|nr:hypothetical protein [Herbinix sp.]
MHDMNEVSNFLDSNGKIKLFPSKKRNKVLVLMYLASKFEPGIYYTEKEINAIIERNHTFEDKWLLRRELIDKGFLVRLTDGSKYWMNEKQPVLEDLLPTS